MLSIVATFEEFQSMLLGANIHVFTDHKNLAFDTLKTQCVLCWRTKLEEFSPMLHYIKGPRNILANNLSSRGSGGKNVIFSNGPNSTSECSKLLY